MKILVVGSNGRVGSLVVKEAINKGLNVVGLAKNENKSLASKFILKDALNLTSDDVKDFDVVVDAIDNSPVLFKPVAYTFPALSSI